MGAISALFHCLAVSNIAWAPEISKGLTIVMDKELYSDTPGLFKFIKSLHEPYIQLLETDCSSVEPLRSTLQKEVELNPQRRIIVFSESCSNPTGRIFCFEGVKELKQHFGSTLWFVIDNTWTTPLGVNPFKFEIDLVVDSLTKYMSGGRAIGGVTLGTNRSFMAVVRNWHRVNGLHVSIANTGAFLEGIKSIKERMKASSDSAMKVMAALVERGVEVIHPFIGSHPSKSRNEALNIIQFAPPLFLVKSKYISKKNLRQKVLDSKVLEWKTSYGGPHCRIDTFSKCLEKEGVSLVRVSIGFEPFDVNTVVDALLNVIIVKDKNSI
jgi:cystathionine beta-lyase/cystathionine gamma-synthase